MNYLFVDIETIPIDKEKYLSLQEDERSKLLNPIDSKIIAIGLKHSKKEPSIFFEEGENIMLQSFWKSIELLKKEEPLIKIVGFNIKSFDLPFLVTRSLVCNTKIVPFNLKDVVDLRESISAFRYGATRGKLKEFASFLGIDVFKDITGSDIAKEFWAGNKQRIRDYLRKDLGITQSLWEKMVELNIDKIQKW